MEGARNILRLLYNSTTETEDVAISEVGKEMIWLNFFFLKG